MSGSQISKIIRTLAVVNCVAFGCGAFGSARGQAPEPGDEFLIVDCLLPGQIRKLGRNQTFVTPRRPVRTTQRDCEIRGGEYLLRDDATYASALRLWLPLAEDGDPRAQLYVGEIYEAGIDDKPDFAKARHWYGRAADQGYRAAAVSLAQLVEKGLGGPADPQLARELYSIASGQPPAGPGAFVQASEAPPPPAMAIAVADASAAISGADPEQIAVFEEKIDSQRAEIERLRAELARADAVARETAYGRTGATSPPLVTLIDPPLSAADTRGGSPPTVITRANMATRTLVGKASPPERLAALLVNGTAVPWQPSGIFAAPVEIGKGGSTTTIVAVDRDGQRGELSLRLQPESVAVTSTASRQSAAQPPSMPVDMDFGRYHALVVGNNAYRRVPRLETARNDARAVAGVLRQRYGFRVTLLEDATRYDILTSLNKMREELTEDDNLLVYYAGHGTWEKHNNRGYWIPIDGELSSTANWLSIVDITDIINVMAAKHVLVIADSCYSGTLTRNALTALGTGMSDDARRTWLRAAARSRARLAMTSGGLAPVLDSVGGEHSVFAEALLRVLRENAGIIEGNQLFREVSAAVTRVADILRIEQVPQYAPIKHAGHEGGDFLFVPRS